MSYPNTYIIAEEITIPRREGDTSSLIMIIPDLIDVTHRNIVFHVYNRREELILSKESPDWYKDGQTIYTSLHPDDTDGLAGRHRWALKVSDASTKYSIGKGDFIITPKIIL